MPVHLWLDILNAFIKAYKKRELSSDLCEKLSQVLIPICEDIEKGKYDIKRTIDDKNSR